MAGNINEAAIFSRDSNFPLLADMQYLEPYMSGGLNRKMLGIILPGVFRGFDVKPGVGLNVVVTSTADGSGAACVEVNGYQITVQQFNDITVSVTKGQTTIIALEANYGQGVVTRQVSSLGTVDAAKLVTIPLGQTLKSNQIEIARVSLSSSATSVKQTDINMETRTRRRVGPVISDAIDSTEQYQVASSNAVRLAIAAAKVESDKKIPIGSLGMGGDSIALEDPFDWQTRLFKGGEYVYINFLKSLNRPGIDYPAGYYQINVMGLTDNGNFQTLLIRPLNYAQPLAPFLISWTGLPGSRVFRTRAIVTSLGSLNDLPGVKPNDLTLLCHAGIYGQTTTPTSLSDGFPILEPGTFSVIPSANTVQHEYLTTKTRRRFTRSRSDAGVLSDWTETATLDKDTFWNAGLSVGLAQKSTTAQNPVYLSNASPDANKIVGGVVAKWGANLAYAGLRRAAANADILGYSVELNGKERLRLAETGQISLYSATVPGMVLRSANDDTQQAAIYQDMSTGSLVIDNTADGTQAALKGKGIQVKSVPTGAMEALIGGTVAKGGWTNWASRGAGLFINVLKESYASNVIKAGCPTDGESIFSIDVAYMSTGNAIAKLNVGSSAVTSQWEFAALNGNFTTPGLVVSGTSAFKGAITVSASLYAQSNVIASGAMTVAKEFSVSGASTLSGALTVGATGSFIADNINLQLQPNTANKAYYIRGKKSDGTNHWYLGQSSDNTNTLTLGNTIAGTYLTLNADGTGSNTVSQMNYTGALSVTKTVSVGVSQTDQSGALLTVNGTTSDGTQGIAISSYAPSISFIDRSANTASVRLRNDGGYLRLDVDNTDNGATWNNNEAMFTPWGGLSLGGTGATASRLLSIGLNTAGKGGLVGTVQYGAGAYLNIGADATVRGVAYLAEMTVGDGVTDSLLADFVDYWSNSNTVNAKASVTLASSFRSYDKSNTAIATAYAFDGRQASRGGVNRWNLFMQGSAPNYVRGQTIIGGTDTSLPASAYALEVRGAQRITTDLVVEGMITANRNDGCIEFTSKDGKLPVIRVNYSTAGNFGFWDQTNQIWLLRNDTSNNWYMPAKLEVANDVTIKTNLDVTSQINSGYRVNISRGNGYIPYMNFVRNDLTDAPDSNQSVMQIFAKMASATSDPFAGRTLSVMFTNVSTNGGGLLYLDARDSSGSTTSRLLLSGDSGSAALTGDVTLSKTLMVSGASTFNGTASFSNDTVMSKTLTVGGVSLFTGAVRANQYLDIGYQNTVAGNRQISFYSGSNTTATSTITVSGATAAASAMTVAANTINLNATVAVTKTFSIGSDGNALRFTGGNTGFIHRKDGNSYYMLVTASGDADGSYNTLRPLTISLSTGIVTLGNGAKVTGNFEVTGAANIGNSLSVSGNSALTGKLAVGDTITSVSEIISTGMNGFRIVTGKYGAFHRNDGDNYYILLTASGKPYDTYNDLRPFAINLANGDVTMGHNLYVGGNINLAGTRALIATDGNINGPVWGGWLSNWAAPRSTAALGQNGWHRDGSTGIIRQWGWASGGTDDSYYTVNLPIPFPSGFAVVNITPAYGSAITKGHALTTFGAILNNSQFGYGISDPEGSALSSNGVYWEAIGW